MRLLLIDTDSVGLAFAWRCASAGHQVRWYVKPKEYNNPLVGEGFKGIEKVDNWVSSAGWADMVFVTSNDDYIKRLDFFREKGVKVFGPSQKSADLEIKRGKGMEFLEKHGIEVPEYKTFKSLKEAEDYVWKHEERFVFKTLGDNEDKSLSYCSKSPADLIARLQRWQKLNMNPKGEVMLQKFIPGIEFAVSRWMGREGYIGKYNENFEHKKLMAGDKGCNTGEMGTVQAYVDQSKIGNEVLAPLEESLVKLNHLGDIDVNCIVDEKGKAWPLEFTCRPGWPAFNIMMVEHKGDPVEWMLDACLGKDTLQVSDDIAIGIVISQPDFPYSNATKKETTDIPIYGVTPKISKYIQPQSIKMAKLPDMDGDRVITRNIWATAGDYLAVVTGTGRTVVQASKRAYDTVDKIEVPDMIYRTDIGKRLKEQIPMLQKHGYATSFEYGEE